MNKLTAEVARRDIGHLKSFQSDPKVGLSLKEEKYLQALEIALPVLEQQGKTVKQIECPFPCGWKELLRISMSDGAFLARDLLEGGEVKDFHRHAALSNTDRLVKVITVILNAQEVKSPPHPPTDTYRQIENDGWIEWGGNGPTVALLGKTVEVRYEDCDTDVGPSSHFYWFNNCGNPIIAYRVIENDGREG